MIVIIVGTNKDKFEIIIIAMSLMKKKIMFKKKKNSTRVNII